MAASEVAGVTSVVRWGLCLSVTLFFITPYAYSQLAWTPIYLEHSEYTLYLCFYFDEQNKRRNLFFRKSSMYTNHEIVFHSLLQQLWKTKKQSCKTLWNSFTLVSTFFATMPFQAAKMLDCHEDQHFVIPFFMNENGQDECCQKSGVTSC